MSPTYSLSDQLVRALVGFPKYLIEFVGGLIVAILTDLDLTILTIFAVAVGFLVHGIWLAVALFFGLYAVLRTVGSLGDGLRDIASAGYRLANRN